MIEYDDKQVVCHGTPKFRVVVYKESLQCERDDAGIIMHGERVFFNCFDNAESEGNAATPIIHTEREFPGYAEAVRFCWDMEIEGAELGENQHYVSYINKLSTLYCVSEDDNGYTAYKYRGFTIIELNSSDFHIIDDTSSRYHINMNNFNAALKYIDEYHYNNLKADADLRNRLDRYLYEAGF